MIRLNIYFITALALDAVAVALLWQHLMADYLSVPIEWPHRTIIALSVWLVYVGDRLFDIKKIPSHKLITQRHKLTLKLKPFLHPLFYILFSINVLLAFSTLSWTHLTLGLIILAACILYTKITARAKHTLIPKEIIVGTLFTAGTFLFLVTPNSIANPHFWSSIVITLILFNSNTLLVPYWEKTIDQAQGQSSIAFIYPNAYPYALCLLPLCIILSIIAFPVPYSIPFIASSLVLLFLHFFKTKISPETINLLSNLALITPVILVII